MSSISNQLSQIIVPKATDYSEPLKQALRDRSKSVTERTAVVNEIVRQFTEKYTAIYTQLNFQSSDNEERTLQLGIVKQLSHELTTISEVHRKTLLGSSKILENIKALSIRLNQATSDQKKTQIPYKLTRSGAHIRTIRTVVANKKFAQKEYEFSCVVSEAISTLKEIRSSRIKAQCLFSYYRKKREFLTTFQEAKAILESFSSEDAKGKENAQLLNERFQNLLNILIHSDNSPFLLSENQKQELDLLTRNFESISVENFQKLKELICRRVEELHTDLKDLHAAIDPLFSSSLGSTLEFLNVIFHKNENIDLKLFNEDLTTLYDMTKLLDCYGIVRAEKILNHSDIQKIAEELGELLASSLKGSDLINGIIPITPEIILSKWYEQFSKLDKSQYQYDINKLIDFYYQIERKPENEAKILILEFLIVLKTFPDEIERVLCSSDKKLPQTELIRRYGTLSYILHKHIFHIQNDPKNFNAFQAVMERHFLARSEAISLISPRKESISFSDEVIPNLGNKKAIKQIAKRHAEILFQKVAEILCSIPVEIFYSDNAEKVIMNDPTCKLLTSYFENLSQFSFLKCLEVQDVQKRAELLGYFLLLSNQLLEKGDSYLPFSLSTNTMFLRFNSFKQELSIVDDNSKLRKHREVLKEINDKIYFWINKYQEQRIEKGELTLPNFTLGTSDIHWALEYKNPLKSLVKLETFLRETWNMRYWLLLRNENSRSNITAEIESHQRLSDKEIGDLINKDKQRKSLELDSGRKSKKPPSPTHS